MIALLAFLLWQSNLEQAQLLLRSGRIDEAQAAVESVLQQHPKSVDALTLRGRIAMARNDFDSARASFEKAAGLAPDSAGVQFLLGFFHYVDNDFVRALPILERARKLRPTDARTALFLALTYDGLARPVEAEATFKETLELEAKRPNVETFVAYGRMLFSQGRLDEAQAQIKRALASNPNSREAVYERARLDFERGSYTDCIQRAQLALKLGGDGVTDRQIHHLLSRAFARTGDSQRAAEHRRQFESIPPRLIR